MTLQAVLPALIEALPVGIALYDRARRLVLQNPALCAFYGLVPGTFRAGSELGANVRLLTYRGLLGRGDPEELATEILALAERGTEHVRRRLIGGQGGDVHYRPLPGGWLLICAVDTTLANRRRDGAEAALARIQAALATLRAGLAVFTRAGRLAAHNPAFAALLGLPPDALHAGLDLTAVIEALRTSDHFSGPGGQAVLRQQAALVRTRPSRERRVRADGRVIELASAPTPDDGFVLTVTDVTALARAEDDRRRRTRLLASVIESVPHAILVVGPDQRVSMFNGAYTRLMHGAPVAVGEVRAEVVRREAAAGEFGSDPEPFVRELLEHDITAPRAYRRTRPDGTVIDVRTAGLPDGGFILVMTDVTSLVAAEAEAARRAELMAGIVRHIPHGVAVYGPDRRLRLLNPAYAEVMDGAPITAGESLDAIIARRARAGEYGPGDPDQIILRETARGTREPQLRRRLRPNGRTIDVRTAPLPDGGHISVVTDATPLVAAEAALARRVAMIEAMLATIRHGIVLWDADRRLLVANPVAATLMGGPPGLLAPGRTLDEVVRILLAEGWFGTGPRAAARAEALLTRDRSTPYRGIAIASRRRVVESRSDPMPGGGFVTTYTDITHVREAEDALRLALDAAQSANAAKSRFLAATGTGLGSPLAAILAQTARLAHDARARRGRFGAAGVEPEAVIEVCDAIARAARELRQRIDQVLDVARLEAGRFELSDDLVDVADLAGACLSAADRAAAAAEVQLLVELAPALPQVRGDRRRLRQILTHLLDNAIRFAGGEGTVTLSARLAPDGALLVEVADTGAGLTPADAERAFEPFVRLGRERGGASTGAGLGLCISRMLARAHGGDLVLKAAPGHGTVACLRLPPARVLQSAAAVSPDA